MSFFDIFRSKRKAKVNNAAVSDEVRYEGTLIGDVRTGYGKLFYSDGRAYRGMFLNNELIDGFMTMKNENGALVDVRYGTQVDLNAVPVVILEAYPEGNKMQMIKEVRELTGWGLAHAKDVVENVPQLIKIRATESDIEIIRSRLEPLGAVIKIK